MPWYKNRRGERLWYEERGAGSPVVLLHGWCMSSDVWKFQYDALPSMRVLAPDLRGHGRSRGISGGVNFEGFASDLVDLFERLDLSAAVLVGWSMGAQIALQAYSELSGRLAGMVLVSATPRFTASDDFPHALDRKEAAGMRLKVQRNARRALDGFYSRLFTENELESHSRSAEITQLLSTIPAPDTEAALDALDALIRTDMRGLLAAITLPTLVLSGAQDRICLPQASCYLKEHIQGAGLTLFPLSGHAPFLTRSHRFNDEIAGFARSVCGQNA